MRLLIYGFGPYKHFRENITQQIIRKLPCRRGLRKIVFPVRFHSRQFINAVGRHRPDVILGLGQCSGGRRVRIERRAVNRRRQDRTGPPRSILPGRAKWLGASLRLKPAQDARLSYDAGDYVCNYSMYVILDHLKRRRLARRFGFLHIPLQCDPAKAVGFLLKVIRGVTSQGRFRPA